MAKAYRPITIIKGKKMTAVKFLLFTLIVLLLTQGNVLARNNPTYKNGILTIPAVDTPEQVGQYLDITMTPTKDGTWKLNTYRVLN
jgi:hypothetical protein